MRRHFANSPVGRERSLPPRNRPAGTGKGWREWFARLGLVIGSVLLALLLAEGLSRLVAPKSDRRENVTLNGERISDFLAPGIVYRQVSNEYDALTTITLLRYRIPEARGNPDIVFIGDSFTFGYGLSDDETFVSLYCHPRLLNCANLGQPGSGTLRQVERLESFLTEHGWRPRQVHLFFFGMSGSFSAGNDFVDNYDRERRAGQASTAGAGPSPPHRPQARGTTERLIGWQSFLLQHSNLVRLLKFHAGPALKALLIAEPGDERMTVALQATRSALLRLEALSQQYTFDYDIYLIVPVQDLLRGTFNDTLESLNSVSPKPAIPTAPLFLDAPAEYYFAYDGHLNVAGSRRIAELLAKRAVPDPVSP